MRGIYTEEQVAKALQQMLATFISRFMRPYQQVWLADQRQLKAGVMSRQIGKSEVIGFEALGVSLEPRREPEQTTVIISASDSQAKLILRKVRRWADLLNSLCQRALGLSIYATKPSSERIVLFNGIQITSIPPNPVTAAGYTGHVFWDEGGRTPHDHEIYTAVMPIVEASGFKFRMIGTPWGDSGTFYEILEGENGTGRPGWAKHRVTIHDAIRMGLKRDIRSMRVRYPDPLMFAQEFECAFVSDASSAFPRALLKAAMELDIPRVPPGYADVERALGIDIGRQQDRTAKAWLAHFPRGFYQVERTDVLARVPFDVQKAGIVQDIEQGGVRAVNIDATGIGAHMGESLHAAYPSIVTPVTFTNQVKQGLISGALSMLSSRRLKLIPDNDLLSDMSAIRKRLTPSGNVVYEAPRNERGHADLAWAVMLGLSRLLATSEVAGDCNIGFIYDGGVTDDQVRGHRMGGAQVHGTRSDYEDREPDPDRIPTPDELGISSLNEEDLLDMSAEEISAWLAATGGVGGF